ncbi:MAG: TRAP transporter small permease [Rhodospirillales bacterium]|jgi:TRAP-type C4-dicarboxylate transport system permease small subunit|nr:TRAP transporter small permease [Rhodospirillales bacterium]
MKNFLHRTNSVLSGFAGWLMLAMMILLITDIVFRTIDMPLHSLAELSVFVMMIVIYVGFARCEEHREHVGLEFVLIMLPKKPRRILIAVSQLLAAATIGLLFYTVTTNAWGAFQSGEAIEGLVDLPIWPTKFLMVVGMLFFFLQGLANLAEDLRPFRKNAPPKIKRIRPWIF